MAPSLDRDGYTLVEDFLSPAGVEALLRAFRSLDSPLHRSAFGASILSTDIGYRAAVDRAIKAVLTSEAAPELDGFRLCFANFLVKAPQHTGAGIVPVHQDPSFVDEPRYESVGVWVPLADTSVANGCLSVIRGSHRFNNGPRGSGAPFPYRADAARMLDPYLEPVPMKAGTAMLFSQRLFHASFANRSAAPRVAVGALFIPREAQLRCYYPNPALPDKLEVFDVDDLFYTRYLYGTRPEGVPRAGVIDYWFDPLVPGQVAAQARRANAST